MKAACHPDRNGGDESMFLFVSALEEHVEECLAVGHDHGGATSSHHEDRGGTAAGDREDAPAAVPFEPGDHALLIVRALRLAHDHGRQQTAIVDLLHLLADYQQASSGRGELAEQKGASYKQLRYLAALADIPPIEAYELGKRIPMSQSMCHHLISTLREGGQAA